MENNYRTYWYPTETPNIPSHNTTQHTHTLLLLHYVQYFYFTSPRLPVNIAQKYGLQAARTTRWASISTSSATITTSQRSRLLWRHQKSQIQNTLAYCALYMHLELSQDPMTILLLYRIIKPINKLLQLP